MEYDIQYTHLLILTKDFSSCLINLSAGPGVTVTRSINIEWLVPSPPSAGQHAETQNTEHRSRHRVTSVQGQDVLTCGGDVIIMLVTSLALLSLVPSTLTVIFAIPHKLGKYNILTYFRLNSSDNFSCFLLL